MLFCVFFADWHKTFIEKNKLTKKNTGLVKPDNVIYAYSRMRGPKVISSQDPLTRKRRMTSGPQPRF